MIEQRFRRDYPGEFVILETRWRNGKKEQKREWIDNPIENQHISGRAAVIGTDADRHNFDYERLQRHRGGLLSKKKFQTYIAGDIWKDMRADFAVETDRKKLPAIVESGYQVDNIVYTTASNCIAFPGEFYLIPYNPRLDILALPIYLAAFDGHQEIFLLGYNQEVTSGVFNWQTHVSSVFGAYPMVKFYIVTNNDKNQPAAWRSHRNVTCMNYQDWVSYCDV